MERQYYLIRKSIIGKYEDGTYYLYKDQGWQEDHSIIMGYLIGYDESEDDDSPYKIGNTDIMAMVEKIGEEEALSLIKREKTDERK